MKTNAIQCNCGRKGTRREGCCIYCREKDPSWRIWQEVQRIIANAGGKEHSR